MGLITCQHSTFIDGFIAEAHGRSDRLQAWLRAESATDVAGLADFADQSHLNRHFRRRIGITPARYAHAITHLKCTKHPGRARRNAPTAPCCADHCPSRQGRRLRTGHPSGSPAAQNNQL